MQEEYWDQFLVDLIHEFHYIHRNLYDDYDIKNIYDKVFAFVNKI